MAIKFSSFQHQSYYSKDTGYTLPSYDITSGEEVINYWRSPYDPNLTYLHNISSVSFSSHKYWSGANGTTSTGAGIGGTMLYGMDILHERSNGSIETGVDYNQGIRYPRFIKNGYFGNIKTTHETISGPEVKSGNVTTNGYDLYTQGMNLIPIRQAFVGNEPGYVLNFKWYWDETDDLSGYGHIPRKILLKNGRLYLQYEGGNYGSLTGIWNFGGGILLDPTSSWYGHMVSIFDASQLSIHYRDYDNDPCIMMFDARYPPSDKKAILRESEMYEYEASPLIGQDMAGSIAGISTRMGLHYFDDAQWGSPASGGTTSGDWGPEKQDIGNDVGHVYTWGKNFSVGNGLCYMNIHEQGGSFWSMDLAKGADRGPVNFKDVNMVCNEYGCEGSPYRYTDVDSDDDYRIDHGDYLYGGFGRIHHDGPMRLEHDRATWISHGGNWSQKGGGYRTLAGDTYGGYTDGKWQNYLLRSMDLQDSRIRTHMGCDNSEDTDNMQSFAVGNGRIYSCMFIDGTYSGSSGGLSGGEHNACKPYYANATYRSSNFSVVISDMNGVPRKNNWTFTGGTLLNLQAGESRYDSDVNRPDISQADRITAGCGRVVFFDSSYSDSNEARDLGSDSFRGTGKGWIYTQDGQFIKAISYQDENWGWTGKGYDDNVEMRFGWKCEIANNLIFVLAPYWRQNWSLKYWGFGRMYIFSLDGELLAAFSPHNVGFDTVNIMNFHDFVTDGVDLFMINYDTPFANNTLLDTDPLVTGNTSNYASNLGYTYMTGYSGETVRLTSRYGSPVIYHIKLPETLSNYYDKISDTYRY